MPLPTAATRLAKGLQSYTVFKGVTSLVYAGLWLGWLGRLAADAHAPRTKCRDVSPTWRALLYVLAWVGIVGTALYVCMLASQCLLEFDVEAARGEKQTKRATFGAFEILCDESALIGGDDTAPPPLAYFASSIAF